MVILLTVMFRPGSDSTIGTHCPQHRGPTSQGTDLQLQEPDHSLNCLHLMIIRDLSLLTCVRMRNAHAQEKHRECSRRSMSSKLGRDVSRTEKNCRLFTSLEQRRTVD